MTAVTSPYTAPGAVEVSTDRMTAFATVNYDRPANLLPADTGAPVLQEVSAVHVPGLRVTAGGQVIESAERFGIGPAKAVGVIAALVILLMTFGSLLAAGMPLVTAGIALITGGRHRSAGGPDRAVDSGDHVRGRVRALDGLRGVPRLARARGMAAVRAVAGVLVLLGPTTWRLLRRLAVRLPALDIEGSAARAVSEGQPFK